MVKNLPANAGDVGWIPGLGISPGVGNGNPFQYSCLEISIDSGAWQLSYSPWGRRELDMTEQLSTKCSLMSLTNWSKPPGVEAAYRV